MEAPPPAGPLARRCVDVLAGHVERVRSLAGCPEWACLELFRVRPRPPPTHPRLPAGQPPPSPASALVSAASPAPRASRAGLISSNSRRRPSCGGCSPPILWTCSHVRGTRPYWRQFRSSVSAAGLRPSLPHSVAHRCYECGATTAHGGGRGGGGGGIGAQPVILPSHYSISPWTKPQFMGYVRRASTPLPANVAQLTLDLLRLLRMV